MLLPLDEQAAHIAAIRAAVPSLVINARVDVFINGSGEVDEAVERGNAYLAAGADCVYPILCPTPTIADLAQRIDGPINVLAERRRARAGRPAGARRRADDVGRRARATRVRRSGARRRGRAQRWMIRAPRPRVR